MFTIIIWVALTYWILYLDFIEFNCAQENGIRKFFFHMIDMCVVNSWILWRRKSDQYMQLFDFKLLIAEHLCKAGKVKSPDDLR